MIVIATKLRETWVSLLNTKIRSCKFSIIEDRRTRILSVLDCRNLLDVIHTQIIRVYIMVRL